MTQRLDRLPARGLRALTAAVFLLQTGCAGWLRADAGFTTSTTLKSSRQGAVIDADFALGARHDAVLADVGLHGKVTAAAGDFAISFGLLHFTQPGPVGWYVLGSVYLLQPGIVDGQGSFGMFGPSAEAGITYKPGRDDLLPLLLTLGTKIEYDIRFTSQPHEGFWSTNLGIAVGDAD